MKIVTFSEPIFTNSTFNRQLLYRTHIPIAMETRQILRRQILGHRQTDGETWSPHEEGPPFYCVKDF